MAEQGRTLPSPLTARDLLDVRVAEYVSVRAQGDQALAGQLSALSLGIAAIAVVLTGIGTIWQRSPLIASVGLMTIAPAVSYFVLLVWATEIKKTLRASSFLRNVCEPRINDMFNCEAQALTWERTGYAYGNVYTYYRAIAASLVSFAVISFTVGAFKFKRVPHHSPTWLWSDWWPLLFGLVVVAIPILIIIFFMSHETASNFRERGPASGETQPEPAGYRSRK